MGHSHRTSWTDELVESTIYDCMSKLGIKRMPTGNELINLNRRDLHCRICRSGGYKGWAEKLNLQLTQCDTRFGQEYELIAKEILEDKGFVVETTSCRHPFDLLLNSKVRVDVKVANPTNIKGSRAHCFRLGKVEPTCDFYMAIALTETKQIERILIVPAQLVKQTMLSIGKSSKYNVYIDRYDLLK